MVSAGYPDKLHVMCSIFPKRFSLRPKKYICVWGTWSKKIRVGS